MKEQIDQKVSPCQSCHAPKIIKDSVWCNRSRLVNAAETLMRDLHAMFGAKYSPDYRCDAAIYFDFDEKGMQKDERAD